MLGRMSDNSLISQPDKHPGPVKRSPIKRHSESITHDVAGNTVYDLLRNGGPTTVTQILTLLAYMQGWSWPTIIIASTGVFLALTIMVAIGITIWQRRKAVPEQATPTSEIATLTEHSCPDRWLHELADNQRHSINSWVHAMSISIQQHDLLRDSPYIDFKFTVHNSSVYTLSLDTVHGSIGYAGRRLGGQPILAANSITGMRPSNTKDCVVRQPLLKEDAVLILNMGGSFEFNELRLRVRGGEGMADVEPGNLILSQAIQHQELHKAYPKLDVEIQEVKLKSYCELDEQNWPTKDLGVVINMKVRFKNLRERRIVIENFRLDANPHIAPTATAKTGEIYESPTISSTKKSLYRGELLDNLSSGPIRADQGEPHEGWLQFTILNVRVDNFTDATPMLIIVDVSGEEHLMEIPALKRG